MQATIERDTTQLTIRPRNVVEMEPEQGTTPYRAPLATFLALVASGRAHACTADLDEHEDVVNAHR